jgi:hypothetical protein
MYMYIYIYGDTKMHLGAFYVTNAQTPSEATNHFDLNQPTRSLEPTSHQRVNLPSLLPSSPRARVASSQSDECEEDLGESERSGLYESLSISCGTARE